MCQCSRNTSTKHPKRSHNGIYDSAKLVKGSQKVPRQLQLLPRGSQKIPKASQKAGKYSTAAAKIRPPARVAKKRGAFFGRRCQELDFQGSGVPRELPRGTPGAPTGSTRERSLGLHYWNCRPMWFPLGLLSRDCFHGAFPCWIALPWIVLYLDYSPGIALLGSFPRDCSCLLYTSPSPRDGLLSRMPSSA